MGASDGTIRISGPTPERDTTTVVLESDLAQVSAIRLEALTDPQLPKQGPGRAPNGNFVLTEIRATAAPRDPPAEAQPIALASATADAAQSGFAPSKPWTAIPKPAGRSRVPSLGTCRARPFSAWANRGPVSDKRGGRSGWNNSTAAAIRWANFASGLASACKTIVPRPCAARII